MACAIGNLKSGYDTRSDKLLAWLRIRIRYRLASKYGEFRIRHVRPRGTPPWALAAAGRSDDDPDEEEPAIMIRLFVGLELPAEIRQRLGMLCAGVSGARWVRPESFHLTVRFIGEVDEGRFDDIHMALSRIKAAPFELTLSGVATFGKNSAPHTLWAGVQRNDTLASLHAKVERALVTIGFEPEGRKYAPHVTLARLKEAPPARLGAYVAENALFRAGPARIDGFVLFSSFLSRSGAIYEPEARYSLSD
jgi:2'-5' RNA ligase